MSRNFFVRANGSLEPIDRSVLLRSLACTFPFGFYILKTTLFNIRLAYSA